MLINFCSSFFNIISGSGVAKESYANDWNDLENSRLIFSALIEIFTEKSAVTLHNCFFKVFLRNRSMNGKMPYNFYKTPGVSYFCISMKYAFISHCRKRCVPPKTQSKNINFMAATATDTRTNVTLHLTLKAI